MVVEDLQVRGTETEIETGFRALALETPSHMEMPMATKKLWGVDENAAKGEEHKGLFMGDQWRESTWSTGPNPSSVSQAMLVQRRSGSFPGSEANNLLSPRSSETGGGLGVKMVEYVLASSPTTKELDSRLSRLVLNQGDPDKSKKSGEGKDQEGGGAVLQANGILANGLDDEQGYVRQASPIEDELSKAVALGEVAKLAGKHPGEVPGGQVAMAPGSGLDGPFDSGPMDALQFEYGSHHMLAAPPPQSMDSPAGLMEYNPYHGQQPRPPLQQFAQQPYTSNPYIMNQDPYGGGPAVAPLVAATGYSSYDLPLNKEESEDKGITDPMFSTGDRGMPDFGLACRMFHISNDPLGVADVANWVYNQANAVEEGPGHTMVPQYYSLPWGLMPTPQASGMMQGGNQGQMIRSGSTRPMTPQGTSGSEAHGQGGAGQYPMIAPPYYDQNGSIMMSLNRGLGTMRHGGPMIMNQANSTNPPRIQGQTPAGSIFNNIANYTSSTNSPSLNYNPSFSTNTASASGYGPSGMGLNQGFGGNTFGPIGTAMGGLGTGKDVQELPPAELGHPTLFLTGSPRRDSFDRRETPGLGGAAFSGLDTQFSRPSKTGQFFNTLGNMPSNRTAPIGMINPGQSLTPPPSLNGSSNSISIGQIGSRIISAAPGAETKYMVRNGNNSFPSNNALFPNRSIQRNPEKPSGRSRLLEEFRNNRYPNLQLRELTNHIVEFSQDQHGSRFIQQKLERATPNEKQMVFNEILGQAYSLMTDVFGNYVIQKFFEFGTPEQKQALAQRVKGHVLPLALQMYGCRVIQKALESIPTDQQKEVVKELDGHVLKCVKDQNGNHVVQKCIECVDPMALQFLINAFNGQVFNLSTHPYGCRVIQRILEHCTPEQTQTILNELHNHVEALVQDQYGNYVIQHVLEHGSSEDKSKIVLQVRGKVLQYSQHKFASNVVEKCVTHALRNEKAILIEEVCNYNDGYRCGDFTMEQKLKQRICIEFCVKLQISATETFEMLNKAFPNDAPKRTTVFEWHSRFKAGRISIEDDPRQGCPKFQRTDENVQKITDLIKENPRTTLLELEQDTGISKTTIGRIVTEDLKLKKTPAKFIPRILTNEQKLCRLATCEDMMEMTRTDPEWKDKIITGDETWVYGYDPETKPQSAEWRGQTVIKEMYLGIRLREAIGKKRPEKWTNGGWILHHDNARPHTAHLMTSFLAKNWTQILLQPPYFPDIAQMTFSCSPNLKQF
ncbi:PUM2 [Cordylochernes scorpioides]|uniref:PUM2 n=1 Tax=Cordylochernes scorpioides TaxID=51811 RepID=A0ABY6LKS4_9ARAC|nr:PUM2 [Cordylochernes scorpioides]